MQPEALLAMLEAYLSAWRQGDVTGCIASYAENARMDDPLLPAPLEGREQIEQYFVQGFADRPTGTTREILNTALGQNQIFFEWTIDSASGGSTGISVWDVADGRVVWDRSYWHAR